MPELQSIFNTVPNRNFLSLFQKGKGLNYKKVLEMLNFKTKDAAAAAKIPTSSARFDEKIPQELYDRLAEWATALELVAEHFEGDAAKTALWFRLPNPLLGNISPRDMIRYGRFKKLLRFIQTALNENR